jgi:outer membrane protein W
MVTAATTIAAAVAATTSKKHQPKSVFIWKTTISRVMPSSLAKPVPER